MDNLRDELLQAYQNDKLLQVIYNKSLGSCQDNNIKLQRVLISLHNKGLIDVIKAYKLLKNNPDSHVDFFLSRHILEEILADLNAPVISVMECVLHLTKEAGRDMAANTIIKPFIDFCSVDAIRPKEALTYIETETTQFIDLLVPVIIAGTHFDLEHYFNEAIRLTTNDEIDVRRRAIFALGRIQYPKGADLLESALAVLEHLINIEDDDHLLGNLITSSFSLLIQHKSQGERYNNIIKLALSKAGDYTIHSASELFFSKLDELNDELLDILLSGLLKVNPSNKGTIDYLDFGLSSLFKRSFGVNKGIEFLEKILLDNCESLTFDSFDSVISELRKQENKAVLNRLWTRWFLNGEMVLCNAITKIVTQTNIALEVDTSELTSVNSGILFFLARKGVGYLFTEPITASSIIISIMRQTTNEELLQDLTNLLYNPLLINYTGKVKDYLTQQIGILPDKTKIAVENALKALENYLCKLDSIEEIPELYPSQTQRNAYQHYFSKLISESMKKAEKESALLSLVSKSVLLYGRKSVNYIYNKNGDTNRMEFPLHSHGTEVEMPRMLNIDPFGLDYMLRIFRAERIVP